MNSLYLYLKETASNVSDAELAIPALGKCLNWLTIQEAFREELLYLILNCHKNTKISNVGKYRKLKRFMLLYMLLDVSVLSVNFIKRGGIL